jgi:hypothetical protein
VANSLFSISNKPREYAMPTKTALLVALCVCLLPFRAQAGEDELTRIGKARLEAAEKAYTAWSKQSFANPALDMPTPYLLSVRWLNAQLDLAEKKEEKITAHRSHLQRMKDWEKSWAKVVGPDDSILLAIRSFQREAEYWMAKESREKK